MSLSIQQTAMAQLSSVRMQIQALELAWDRYDHDNRFVERAQVEEELEPLYIEESELKNLVQDFPTIQ